MTKKDLALILPLCCVGERYNGSKLNHPALMAREHYRRFKRFVDEFDANVDEGIGMFLHGDYGTGKTSLAVILMKVALAKDLNPYFVRASWIPKIVIEKPRRNYLTGDDVSVKEILETCDVLVIDNLNEELAGKWQSTALEDLIRDRYEEKLMTIVTSNLTPQNLKLVVSPGTTSLMADTMVPLKVSGGSWRIKR